MTVNRPAKQKPLTKRTAHQTTGSIASTRTSVHADAMAASEANALTCPTARIMRTITRQPRRNPAKYAVPIRPIVAGENPSMAPRSASNVPCSPLPPSRMPAASSSGMSGRIEDMAWSVSVLHCWTDSPARTSVIYRRRWAKNRLYLDKSGPVCAFRANFEADGSRCCPRQSQERK